MNITFLDSKNFFLAGFLLLFLIVSIGNVSATELSNNITINNVSIINCSDSTNTINTTDLNSNSVLPFSHNSNSLNNIKINSSVIIKTNNNSYNASEILKNSSISDLMDKTMYNNEKNINSLNFSNDNILIDNLTIKDIMNNLFKDDSVINLSSTINYIDHIINYDIVQMRITYKTVKEYLININVNNVNISAVDKDLKPFMLGLRNKAGKLTVLAIFINALTDYFKSNIKPNQNIKDNNTPIKYIDDVDNFKHIVNVNNLSSHVKQLTHMIAYLNFIENFLKSINTDLRLIDNIIQRV